MVVAIEQLSSQSGVDDLITLRIAWGVENGRELNADFTDRLSSWLEREQDRRVFFVARDESRPVGMVNLVLFERMPSIDQPGVDGSSVDRSSTAGTSDWGYLSNMYVVPERRGAGVGASLIAAVLEVAAAQSLERIVLNPTTQSIPLYERHGFRGDNQLMVRI